MELNDLEQVCKIESEIFSRPWTQNDFATSLTKEENIYLVVEKEEKIVGYCGMWGIVGEGQINNVAMHKAYRREGIAYEMLQQFLQEGKKKQLTSFTLEVRESNQAALALYKKLGFQAVGIRKDFYEAPRENAIIMWLTYK